MSTTSIAFDPSLCKRVATGAFQTAYYEGGTGETIVLIHGGGAGADSYGNWIDCFPLLASKAHVLAMDMVGFGLSDAPDPSNFEYTQEARIQQAIVFIEAKCDGPVNLVGNSMGGATSLGVAMRRPDLVSSLVLMGSAGLNRTLSAALAPMVHYDYSYEGMRKIVGVLANPGLELAESSVRYRYELSTKADKRKAYQATMGWVKQQGGLHYEEEDIAKVKSRTMVVAGKDDLVIPMMENVRFLQLLENSSGYFIPHCRHWVMIEYPVLFARIVWDFVRGDKAL